jgi:hypothetical protein
MVVLVHIGRRVPKRWFARTAHLGKGYITFQSNIWQIIKQSLQLAKKKANKANTLSFVITTERESEDLSNEIEWMKVVIHGTPEQEIEEYQEAMNLYSQLDKVLGKQKIEVTEDNKKMFKSKLLTPDKIKEAYEKGYGAIQDKNIANKLLELGIITHIEIQENT